MRLRIFSQVLILVGVACLLPFGASKAHAATIQETDQKQHCAFWLQGPIEDGDFAALSGILNRRGAIDPLDARAGGLCLNSHGGSYDEALKISELLYERGLATVVEDGAECYSACAIIFMAGTAPDRLLPLRKLSAGGILGFHAPYFSMPDRQYSKQQVENVSQSMRRAVLALMQLAALQTRVTGGDFLKKSLIQGMLAKGPDETLFVSNVFDAARWDIDIFDADGQFDIRSDNKRAITNICKNFHYANLDQSIPPAARFIIQIEDYASRYSKDDFRILVRRAAHSSVVCEIYARQSNDNAADVTFFACSFDEDSAKSFGDCREYKTSPLFGRYVPKFFALDPQTPLKSFHR